MAHGSPDPRWRQPFEDMDRHLAEILGRDRVTLAYMEFVSPTLLERAEEARARGIERLVIYPLFMSGGGHVSRDIPGQVLAVSSRYSDLKIEVLPPLGEDPVILDLVLSKARTALEDPLD